MSAGELSTADELEIRDLHARYAWSVATGDVDGFAALFTSDAVIEEADHGLRYEGPEVPRFLEDWMRLPGSAGRQHWIAQTVLEGGGERCTARSYAMAVDTPAAGPISPLIMFLGRYEDELVKLDDRWLFRRRRLASWSGDVLEGFPACAPPASEGGLA